MIEALLNNENIPIGAALLIMVIIMLRHMASRDKVSDATIRTIVESQHEVQKETTAVLRDNTAVIGRMDVTLQSMDRAIRGEK
jgi:hypothetical protein